MRVRTADPLLAKQVLYQLSYIPKEKYFVKKKMARRGRENYEGQLNCQNVFLKHLIKFISKTN
jgi:hypothetical protein